MVIVTGANMAGKSTFLRTVGVNLILAQAGAPVCAADFLFTPIALFTNMRTTDSLFNDESYFYAELKRLKNILENLRRGKRIFVILDEMLKGTNSVDKLKGSKELISQLVQLQAVALIATHDLKLAEMENDFPQTVINKCFEIHIEKDELTFDYKLVDGVTRSMNATFLMKKMGIILRLVFLLKYVYIAVLIVRNTKQRNIFINMTGNSQIPKDILLGNLKELMPEIFSEGKIYCTG